MSEETKVAKVPNSQYPVLAGGENRALSIVQQHLSGDDLSWLDLSRIEIAQGGKNIYSYIGLDGAQVNAPAFDAVLIMRRKIRAYFTPGQPLGAAPPACFSDDGTTGYGDITNGAQPPCMRDCATCPMAVFGTAVKDGGLAGKGQACQLRNILFVLLPGMGLPSVLSAPPTSARAVQRYIIGQAAGSRQPFEVTTHFGLEKQTNEAGQPFSIVTLTFKESLSPAECAAAESFHKVLSSMFTKRRMTAADAQKMAQPMTTEVQDEA